MGGAQDLAPFGDGQRCVAPGQFTICRFDPKNAGPSGTIAEGPGMVSFSQTLQPACAIDPGQGSGSGSLGCDPLLVLDVRRPH